MHHSEPPPGEAAHNVIPKKQMECAPQQPSSFVRLSQVFPRVPQVGSAPVHGNLDDADGPVSVDPNASRAERRRAERANRKRNR